MLTLGDKLRRQREGRDTTLAELSGATGIGLAFLEALERNEFEALPGPAFGKLYIRAYAAALDFDPEPLIAVYDNDLQERLNQLPPEARRPRSIMARPRTRAVQQREAPAAVEDPPSPPAAPESGLPHRIRQVPRWAVVGLAGLVVVTIGLYLSFSGSSGPAEPSPPPQAQPEAPASGEPVESAALPITADSVEIPVQTKPEPAPPGPSSDLSIEQYGVGRGVANHRLEGQGDRFEEGEVVWFSTRVLGGSPGERIRHVWLRDGKLMQSIELELGGSHWRTHSTKTLWGPGEWVVEARDAGGRTLARSTFDCVAR